MIPKLADQSYRLVRPKSTFFFSFSFHLFFIHFHHHFFLTKLTQPNSLGSTTIFQLASLVYKLDIGLSHNGLVFTHAGVAQLGCRAKNPEQFFLKPKNFQNLPWLLETQDSRYPTKKKSTNPQIAGKILKNFQAAGFLHLQ